MARKAMIQELLALSNRQIVEDGCHKTMPGVEVGKGPIAFVTQPSLRLRGRAAAVENTPGCGPDSAAIVNGFRERVSSKKGEAVRESPRQLYAPGVVIRTGYSGGGLNQAEFGEWAAGSHGARGTGVGII